MKKLVMLVFVVGLGVLLGACEQQSQQAGQAEATPTAMSSPTPQGPNPRFYKVQERLDPGGSFYLYADTKGLLKDMLKMFEPMAKSPGAPPQFNVIYTGVDSAIDRLGLYGVHDLGISVVDEEGEYSRYKSFVSTPEGRSGLLALLGEQPHPLTALEYAPEDTALFYTFEFDTPGGLELLKNLIREVAGQASLGVFEQQMQRMEQQSGVRLRQALGNMKGEFAVILALDPEEKLTIREGGAEVSIDSPKVVVMLPVGDGVLYEDLKQVLGRQGMVSDEASTGTLRRVAIQTPPLPQWRISPVMAIDEQFLYLSTHAGFFDRVMETKQAGGPTLAEAEEFGRLSEGLPTEGNSMEYVSARFMQTYKAFNLGMRKAVSRGGRGEAVPMAGTQIMEQFGLGEVGMYSIAIAREDGLQSIGRSPFNARKLVAAMATVPAAVLTAIAVPNFLEAQGRAKVSRARADMRSLATAIEAYRIDTNAYPAWSADPGENMFGDRAGQAPTLREQPTFKRGRPLIGQHRNSPMTLTTPIAYITQLPADPFSPAPGAPFCYYSPREGDEAGNWILWSAGPDKQYDLTIENIQELFRPTDPEYRKWFVPFTYDPTNGTTSEGDVYRMGGRDVR